MISIIVPIYNAETCLKSCLDSILSQTYNDFELILINDGSKDKSAEICDYYAALDKRVVVIHKKNAGAGAARNDGLKIAQGDYIGFVDSDDYIDTNMYATLYKVAMEYNADIVQCGYEKVSQDGKKISQSHYEDKILSKNRECFEEYCKGYNIDNYSPCKIFKKIILDNVYFGDFHYSEDAYFIIQAFLRCNKLVVVKNCFYKYVQTENSVCRRPFNLFYQDTVRAGEKMYEMCYRVYPEYSFYFARYIAMWARTCYIGFKNGNFVDKDSLCIEYWTLFVEYFKKSKIILPSNLKELLLVLFRISPNLYQQLQIVIKKIIL